MKRTEKTAKKREEIVDGVLVSLSRLDMREATVRSICEAAGISLGTFYRYFPGKDSLIAAILGRIDAYLTSQVLPGLRARDEAQNLIAFGRGFALYTSAVGGATGGVISNAGMPLPATPEELEAERRRALYTIPREILCRGQKKGQFSQEIDAGETADMLVIALRGHSLEWARRNRSYLIEDKVEVFMRLFVRALRG